MIMQKKVTNHNQEVLAIFQPLEKWPEGYKASMPSYAGLQSNVYGMDTETEGLNPYSNGKIISVAISPKEKIAFSFYAADKDEESMITFIGLLRDPDIILVGHNIKYDANWISLKFGITIRCMLFDTMFAQYLIDENIESNSLNYLSGIYPDLKGYKDKVNRNALKLMAKEDELLYNCKDADVSRRLYNYFVPKLREGGYERLMTTASMVLPVLSKMETRGVYLDKPYADKTKSKLFNELVSLRYKLSDAANTLFNPDSYKDLSSVLYKTLQFTCNRFTESGNPSTDAESVSYLFDQCKTDRQNVFLDSLLEYKKKVKLITTYYQPIERWIAYDGRVHTEYSLGKQDNDEQRGGTVTGRLTARNPNLQQIPREKIHRGMFAATEGYYLLDGDFSQLELRVAAFLSQEPVMLDAFHNGQDIHSAVMADLTGIPYADIQTQKETNEKIKTERVAVKRINFGILYGVQARRLQRLLRLELGITKDLEECRRLISRWLNKYSKVAEWIETQKLQAAYGKFVGMPLGQRRRLPFASFEKTAEAAEALRQATNFPVQSFASWICLIGLVILDNYWQEHIGLGGHILMQVHDSVTSEVKLFNGEGNQSLQDSISSAVSTQRHSEIVIRDVKKIMERDTLSYIKDVFGVNFNVPLVFDTKISERWG